MSFKKHLFLDLRVFLVLLVLCLCCARFRTVAESLPSYEAAYVTGGINIDGKLDEKAWTESAVINRFANNRDGSHSDLSTEARILYDRHFIYFAFRVTDTNVWATMKRRDEHLWLEEVVEVFLEANPAIPNYIELEVNPLGTMLDIYLLDRRKPLHYESWNSEHLRWAVQVDGTIDGKDNDRGWTCEIALPVEEIATATHNPPHPGDRWRMNLYRVDQKPQTAELAWSPTLQDDFHVLSKLGELVFTDRKVGKP